MENKITFNCPLYLCVGDVMILLVRKSSFAYNYMAHLRTIYPERCKNGKNIPSNVVADYTGLSLEEIGKTLMVMKTHH